MEDLIQFLDLHSGSLTVLVAGMSMSITLVYVVATILFVGQIFVLRKRQERRLLKLVVNMKKNIVLI